MKESLLRYLECPQCENEYSLKIFKKDNERIIDGIIYCSNCQNKYLVIEGIPRFVLNTYLEYDIDYKNFLIKYSSQDNFIYELSQEQNKKNSRE